MIEWLVSQQIVLCTMLGLLVLTEHFLTSRLGTAFTYKLWLLLPLSLLANNLPLNFVSIPANTLSRYIVGVTPSLPSANFNLLMLAWTIGASLIATYIMAHHFAIAGSISKEQATQAPDSTRPDTYYSSKATTPMLFGFFTPKILLPFYFNSAFSNAQQALILEHERVHSKHHDHMWNSLALCFAVIFWFNPLTWIALKSFRSSQELACDHVVLKTKTSNEKLIYAKALLLCAEHNSKAVNLYPTFGEKSTMIKRLNSIKHPTSGSKLLAAGTAAIFALVTANMAFAKAPPQSPEAAQSKINEAHPITYVSPHYPEAAARENTEGFVILKFDITETGTTANISVVDASPAGVFDESAKTALKQWKYKPLIQGGVAGRQTGLLVQLDYKLDSPPLTAGLAQ